MKVVEEYKTIAEHYQCGPHEERTWFIDNCKYVIMEILDKMDEVECMEFLLKATDENIKENYNPYNE